MRLQPSKHKQFYELRRWRRVRHGVRHMLGIRTHRRTAISNEFSTTSKSRAILLLVKNQIAFYFWNVLPKRTRIINFYIKIESFFSNAVRRTTIFTALYEWVKYVGRGHYESNGTHSHIWFFHSVNLKRKLILSRLRWQWISRCLRNCFDDLCMKMEIAVHL